MRMTTIQDPSVKRKFKELIKDYCPESIIDFAKLTIGAFKKVVSKRKISVLLKENREIYLEIGSGSKKGENGWTTLDMAPGCDIFWDLSEGLPFPDETVHKIYSSHVLEHFTYIEGQRLLAESLRVLIPGGLFSICVPNARIYIDAYAARRTLEAVTYFGYEPAFNATSMINYVNYVAYMDGHHKYMFDEENLIADIEKSGFKSVRLRGFDRTIDLEVRDFESIYAEAKK